MRIPPTPWGLNCPGPPCEFPRRSRVNARAHRIVILGSPRDLPIMRTSPSPSPGQLSSSPERHAVVAVSAGQVRLALVRVVAGAGGVVFEVAAGLVVNALHAVVVVNLLDEAGGVPVNKENVLSLYVVPLALAFDNSTGLVENK